MNGLQKTVNEHLRKPLISLSSQRAVVTQRRPNPVAETLPPAPANQLHLHHQQRRDPKLSRMLVTRFTSFCDLFVSNMQSLGFINRSNRIMRAIRS